MALYSYQKGEVGLKSQSFNFNFFRQFLSAVSLILGSVVLVYLFLNLSLFPFKADTPLSLVAAKNEQGNFLNADKNGQVLGITDQIVWDRFYLSIPKLGIEKARVITNVDSDKKESYFPILSYATAHYKGTSYPGEEGNVFIYGHSVLPIFFNKNNYLSIFSKNHELQSGDQVEVYWGEKKFVYMIYESKVVSPENLDVLDFKKSGEKTLTLMTCNPPGTYFKRLLVNAKLISQTIEPF